MNVETLFVAVLVNAVLMSLALLVGVGLRLRSGLQSWQYALLAQALGFGLLTPSPAHWRIYLATLGVMALSASASATLLTVHRFLKLGPLHWVWWAVPLGLGALHLVAYAHLPLAVALTNVTIGLQTGWFALLLLRGSGQQRWRWLCGLAALANAVLMLARVVLALGYPESYPRFSAPHPLNIAHLMLLNASLVLGTVGFLLAHRDEAERALVKLATVDSLTGLLTRREWLSRADAALRATSTGAVLMMFDLDHFKRINDERGHPVGDEVLRLVGEAVRSGLRASDLVGRYGGEEFCALLQHCDPSVFAVLDDRLHQTLVKHCRESLGFEAAFSAGAVRLRPGESLTAAIQRADELLYRAKHLGRGRTCCDEPDLRLPSAPPDAPASPLQ